jgi:hypothetical protein
MPEVYESHAHFADAHSHYKGPDVDHLISTRNFHEVGHIDEFSPCVSTWIGVPSNGLSSGI